MWSSTVQYNVVLESVVYFDAMLCAVCAWTDRLHYLACTETSSALIFSICTSIALLLFSRSPFPPSRAALFSRMRWVSSLLETIFASVVDTASTALSDRALSNWRPVSALSFSVCHQAMWMCECYWCLWLVSDVMLRIDICTSLTSFSKASVTTVMTVI